MYRFTLAAAALFATASLSAELLEKPTLSRTSIVFVYANELWSVPRNGGEAKRLTAGPGSKTNPKFSPDGSQLAFTAEYDGNVDVFTVPAEGGVPKRVTFHPAPDVVLGWTPDGSRILFASPRASFSRFFELFTVAPGAGGLPDKLPLPMGFEGSYSPDAQHLAYVPIARAFTAWKRYRGGQATPIWIVTLANGHTEKIPREGSNDYNPMWAGDKIYFLSDRNGPVSLFSYEPRSKQVKQVVENQGLDLKSASDGPGAIVYEQFGALNLYDLKSGKTSRVNVHISGDLLETREHLLDVSKRLHNPHISPTGARAVFEARGEILTVPAEKGDVRNLTNTTAVMERDPAWSPDGKTIAYFSDESGEYSLHLAPQSGLGEVKKIVLGEKPGFYFTPRWSPDSKKIAYVDSHLTIWYIDLEQKKPVKVDKDLYWTWAAGGDLTPVWSPDSKWLAYARRLKNYMAAIHVYSLADGNTTQVTDGMSDCRYPVFDKDGKYLYFSASTDAGASLEPDIHSFSRPVSRSVYVAVLSKSQASPLAPESDEEKDAKPADKKDDDKKPAEVAVQIDFDNISQRILALPLPPRRYTGLQIGKTGVLFAIEAPTPIPGTQTGPLDLTVHRFDLKTRKSDVAIGGVRGFEISQNGEKMLYRQGERWVIAAPKPMATGSGAPPTPPPAASASDGTLKTEGIQVRVDPRQEWKQMYHEVWRIERDFFYDPNYHGLNLEAAEKKYQPYLEFISSRTELNYLFQEMLGELTIGHLGAGGGDTPDVKHVSTGLLGADYQIENGRYRFARVFNGENWNPQLKAPLTQPGVNVAAGEYLLAVNGQGLRASDNIYSLFENTSGKSVVLKVGPDPSGANSREVTVVPVSDEGRLRNLAWIEDNRRKVDQMTNGRVAYIYMPDTSTSGYINFNRYFFAQVGKEAAIVDERFNAGGALATDIIEYLKRPLMSLVATRDGADESQPQGAIFGPKVMIINEFAGSGGDAMPWYFHRAGVGKLIGKRTWGGLVGRALSPELMDGGFATAPSSGVWNPNGEWEVENHGITPDIEVDMDPELVRSGHDPQLEKAVQVVMEELAQHPVPTPKRPAYPNYHKTETSTH
ncbi:MAG TPA: PDZ domain-containing protein [Bryobacteraceae bacterium]|nr:PDZ domain-containing protein [Bryobacteraceae bacterium]